MTESTNQRSHNWRGLLTVSAERYSGAYLWLALVVIFWLWIPNIFFTAATAHSIASGEAIPALVAFAILIPLAAGMYDLSVGASTNLAAVLVVVLQVNHHVNAAASVVITLLAALAIGLLNSFLIVRLRIDSFIATLGISVVLAAVQEIVTNDTQPASVTSQGWLSLTQNVFLGFQVIIVYVIVVALLIWWLLDHTPAGRYMYAIGGNQEAARLSGVRVGKWQTLALCSSSVICGLAGVLYGSQNGPSLTFGTGLLLPAFAAVFLGSTQVRPGQANIWGTVIAVILLATGVAGLQLVTGVQWLNNMFSGVALIVAVGTATWRQQAGRQQSLSRRIQRMSQDPSGAERRRAKAIGGPEH
jgi:ribose transport system permease protein